MAGVLAVGPDSKSDAAAAGAAAEFVPLPAAARSAEADHWSSSTEPTSILTPP